jgi:membrane fusion protein (multidrug efflux system)
MLPMKYTYMNKSALLIGLIAASAFTACKNQKIETKEESAKYAVTTPLVTDTTYSQDYVAEIQSLQNIEIRAKVKGYIETINVDEGQQVRAGQLLFTIRPKEYEAELLKAKAEVKSAEIEVQNTKTLADKNIVSKNELAAAQAKLDQAKAEEAMAELYVSYTQIKAPFDGVIDRLKFKAGSLIDEGTLLTTLSNNKEVYAYFNVSEQDYLSFKAKANNNDKNIVSLILANNQPHKYKGKIETIEGEFDSNTGSIPFRAKFPNPELLLKHGETGKVQLTMAIQNAMLIPQKATYELQDKIYVYVVDANNVVKSRNIVIKQKLPNFYVVDSGINAGERFLLEGIQYVKDDDKIEPINTPIEQVVATYKNN